MPFTSDPGAYSPPPHICQSGICGYITHWPFLGERPWLRENECGGEDLKQCKQHLCFLVVMAPALGRDGGNALKGWPVLISGIGWLLTGLTASFHRVSAPQRVPVPT